MGTDLRIFLLVVEPSRRLFYSEVVEPPGGSVGSSPTHGVRGWLEATLLRMKDGWEQSQGKAVRLSRRLWDWLHRRTHPDEVLYARLRKAEGIELIHPHTMDAATVDSAWSGFLRRGRWRHLRWLVVNTLVAPLTIVLAPLPGPNLVGYWFVYRAIHHLFILHGLGRVRDRRVAVRLSPEPALAGLSGDAPDNLLVQLERIGCSPTEAGSFLERQGLGRSESAAGPAIPEHGP
jgi:hypothetical protein